MRREPSSNQPDSFPCRACGSPSARPGPAGLATCAACGVVRLDPFPTPEEIRAIYGAGYFDAWGMQGAAREAVRAMKCATFRRRLRELGGDGRGKTLLDVGCALGFLLHAARDEGYEPHGVELSAYAAREAEKDFPGRVVCGTLEEARLPDARFDVVVLSDLIEHIPEPRAFLGEVRRVLRPGGRLLIVTPDIGSVSARVMGRRWFHRKIEHVHYYTRHSLGNLLRREGFRPSRVAGGTKALSVAYLASQFRVYRLPAVTPAMNLLARLLPASLAARPLWWPTGELVMTAVKTKSRVQSPMSKVIHNP